MYITTLTLTRVFICDPTNPSMQVVCGSAGSLGGGGSRVHAQELDGEFREYAGARIRLVTTTTTKRSIPITLRALLPQQARQIRRWRGTTLLFRDTYGTRLFGAYLATQELNIPRTTRGNLVDLAVQVNNVTYSDSV